MRVIIESCIRVEDGRYELQASSAAFPHGAELVVDEAVSPGDYDATYHPTTGELQLVALPPH